MSKINYSETFLAFENSMFEELATLESLLKLTRDTCLKQEIDSKYYDLDDSNKIKLSQERNHYLNLLTIAIDKINKLNQINQNLEKEIYSLK